MLDKKDLRILRELDLDSRQPYKDIAKKIRLSRDSVVYRINKMMEEGIIKGFWTIIDKGKLGLTGYHFRIKLEGSTPEIEDEMREFFRAKSFVTWEASADGKYDLVIGAFTEDVRDIMTMWDELREKYLNCLAETKMTILKKGYYYSRKFISGDGPNDFRSIHYSEPEKCKIDNIDREIVKLLSDDARMSSVTLAEKTGVCAKTISNRIRELEKKKVIRGYTVFLDMAKLGYDYYKVFLNLHNVDKEKMGELTTYMVKNPNIVFKNEIIGGEDIEFGVHVKSMSELRELINEMKKKFSNMIISYDHLFLFDEKKYHTVPDEL